ncbi:MAG TPA: aldose 1-epimerase [Candidatus Acidoferrales bacterium]|nr:aldose 1-epimerase [Candidatus Acidoferrales bacterium]
MSSSYSATRTTAGGVEVVRLADTGSETGVSIAVGAGNMAYEFTVRGNNFLWFPFADPAGLLQHPRFCGVPFLAPWANRLDSDSYWVNGRQHTLNSAIGNFQRDPNGKPIHGLLNYSREWQLVSADADDHSAYATSRLEFGAHPGLMAQFPFAHTIEMTYRLEGGVLQVETALQNHAAEPLPVAIGYHPYFQLQDAPPDQWKVHLAARSHLVLDSQLIPTGERRPVEFGDPHTLEHGELDDVFGDLVRGGDGCARFWVAGRKQRLTVVYGPKYPVAVVYAPQGQEFICFEPMAAVTNAFNLAHAGLFPDLQTVPPGGEWRESFWIEVQA